MPETATATALRTRYAGTTVALVADAAPAPAVAALAARLTALGLRAPVLCADATLAEQVRRTRPALCADLTAASSAASSPLGAAQVPALLAAVGAACVGPSAAVLALLRDRAGCLRLLRGSGVPAPGCAELPAGPQATAHGVALHYPVLVHRAAGSGFDAAPHGAQTLVGSADALAAALGACPAGSVVLVEETLAHAAVHTVAVLGNPARSVACAPAPPAALAERVGAAAVAAVERLGLRDFARVSVAVDAAGDALHVIAVDARLPLGTADEEEEEEELLERVLLAALMRVAQEQQQQQQQQGLGSPTADPADGLFGVPGAGPLRAGPSALDQQLARLRQRQAVVEDDVDLVVAASDASSSSSATATKTATTTTTTTTKTRSYKKSEVPAEQWNDWRWQLANRLKTAEQLRSVLPLTLEEEEAFSGAAPLFPVAVTPYYASLIDARDAQDPIRLQVLPRSIEGHRRREDIEDSLGEDAHMPVPGLVHRYPDRVLMLVSMTCGSYCRFCTRNRVVGTRLQTGPLEPLARYYERQLAYVRANARVRDVLLSGGDPLLIPMRTLDWLLTELHRIPHVEVVRIGSRVPVFLPQRITPELCAMLAAHHPLWLNTHVNHPNELAPDCCAALARLADAGIPLGCQTVLLAGVNDCPHIMTALVHKLVQNRVRPYYIYQCDLVVGAAHFRTPVAKLVEIIEALRGHTSGFCVPTAVIDAPHGGGKVPVMPAYILSQSETRTVVRNFEGFVSTYTGPRHYRGHNPATCRYCAAAEHPDHPDPQDGVAGLLAGHANVIKPVGWDDAHLSRRSIVAPHGTPEHDTLPHHHNRCNHHEEEEGGNEEEK